MKIDEKYMRRALQLARCGMGNVSPNPMVGAVIVNAAGNIIGEGYHRRFGEGHAEVNAVASVADRELLRDATMYVTLEPCSHYGKTPPCAKLIIDCGIPRVVVGAVDPNEKVSGRGIAMLRDVGVEVVSGVMAEESRRLNVAFITAHSRRRPFVTLKWAQSQDGYMDMKRAAGQAPAAISTHLGRLAVHRLRAMHDAILVGSGTVLADDPLLDTRLWGGRTPRPVILDRRGRVTAGYRVMEGNPIVIAGDTSPRAVLDALFAQGISSLLVEGGSEVLHSFIASELWDVARVECSPARFGNAGVAGAPSVCTSPAACYDIDSNKVFIYSNNPLIDVKNL